MTVRIRITHEQQDGEFALRITDYNGTKELHPGQSGEFFVKSDSTVTIEEFSTRAAEVPAATDTTVEPAVVEPAKGKRSKVAEAKPSAAE